MNEPTKNMNQNEKTDIDGHIPSFEVMAPSALEAQERAQIDVQIATAHHYKRPDLSIIKAKMKSFATLDEETAEGCFYVLNRQGKEIRGPSARLAEIAISCFGNLRAASRIIANDGRTVTAQAVCHDLENNVSISIEVKRRITDKNGKTYSDDMQVTTGNAACSIALRNAAFKVIPMALIRPVYDAARATAIGDVKTLASRREKAVETFGKMGIVKERVLDVVKKATVEDIDLAALETLLGIHTAIKDGDTSIDEAFPAIIAKKPVFEKKERPNSSPAASGGDSSEASAAAESVKSPESTAWPSGGLMAADKLGIMILEAGFKFADFVPVLHGSLLCAKNAASTEDLTDKNIDKIIADFASITDAVKQEKTP